MNFHSPEEREAWVRFAAAVATEREVSSLEAAGFADLLLAEFRKRVEEDTASKEPFATGEVYLVPKTITLHRYAESLWMLVVRAASGLLIQDEARQLIAELEGK